MPTMITVTAAAAAARADGRQVDAVRLVGATAPDRARPLAALGLAPDHAFERLSTRGVVREAAAGAYYLDEAALIAHRDRSTASPRALLVTLLLLAAGLAALAAAMRRRR